MSKHNHTLLSVTFSMDPLLYYDALTGGDVSALGIE